MPIGKKGLGRGINSLINEYDTTVYEAEKLVETGVKVQEIEISRIKPNPNQPRKIFDPDALSELAGSIQVHGIIQPLIVEEIAEKSYVIVAGERRYRAAKLAGLETVPCLVRTFTAMQRIEVALIENIQRESLNPVEEARAYQYLITAQGIRQEELAVRLGKSRPAVTNSLRLLNLPPNMLDAVESGKITPGHARALLSVVSPADREVLFAKILKNTLSVRQAEDLAASLNRGIRAVNPNTKELKTDERKSREITIIEERFLSASGCRVALKGKLTKGRIQIPFDSSDELDRIYRIFSKGEPLFEEDDE